MQLGNKHRKPPWFVRRFFNISIRLIDVYAYVRVEISNGIKRDFNQIDPMTENSLTENDWDKSALCAFPKVILKLLRLKFLTLVNCCYRFVDSS